MNRKQSSSISLLGIMVILVGVTLIGLAYEGHRELFAVGSTQGTVESGQYPVVEFVGDLIQSPGTSDLADTARSVSSTFTGVGFLGALLVAVGISLGFFRRKVES